MENAVDFSVGEGVKSSAESGAGDGDRTRNQRLGKPLLYH